MCIVWRSAAWGEVYSARAALAQNPASFQPAANAPTAIQAAKQLATYFASDGQLMRGSHDE